MINVPLSQRIDINASQPIQQAVQDAEACFNGRGRVLLRPSGTEPLIRVMVEGEDETLVREQAEQSPGTDFKSVPMQPLATLVRNTAQEPLVSTDKKRLGNEIYQ